MSIDRPLPRLPEPDSDEFWAATKRLELTFQRCDDCGRVVFYPRKHCPNCGATRLSWHVSDGVGAIYSFSVVRRSTHAFFKSLVPYAVAWVELDEGFRMLTQLVNVDVDGVNIGDRVRVAWETHDDVNIPLFEPELTPSHRAAIQEAK